MQRCGLFVAGLVFRRWAFPRRSPELTGSTSNIPAPDQAPTHSPAEWEFNVWTQLEKAAGREFLRFLSRAIDGFPQYPHVFR